MQYQDDVIHIQQNKKTKYMRTVEINSTMPHLETSVKKFSFYEGADEYINS